MRALFILALCAALGGCAAQPSPRTIQYRADEAAKLEKDLAGFSPGKPQSCIDVRDLNGPKSYGDTTILFRANRRLIYRNDVQGSCRGAGDDYIMVNEVFGSRLCRGDISRLVDRTGGFFAGSCAMGDFVPYRRDKKG
jgi:hypothetical protein